MEKRPPGEEEVGFFRKDKCVLGEQIGDKQVCDNVCLCSASPLSVLAMKLPRGDLWYVYSSVSLRRLEAASQREFMAVFVLESFCF